MIDSIKVGKAISVLRRRQKLTQRDLARKLNVSDKAVSKWERGLGLPDISILSVLSTTLDTDVNSILDGDCSAKKENWIGLLDLSNSKIKLNVKLYDKPLMHYLLSYYMLAGIKNIYIICDKKYHKEIYKIVKGVNIKIEFIENIKKLPKSNVMLISDPIFIYCQNLTRTFNKAMLKKDGITIISLPSNEKKNEENYINYDSNNKVVSNSKECVETMYFHKAIPMYFIPITMNSILQNGVYNIDKLQSKNILYTIPMFRGVIYIPLENKENINDVADIVKIVQKRDFDIGNIKEIQKIRGFE